MLARQFKKARKSITTHGGKMRFVNGEEFMEEVEKQLTLEQDMERNPEQYKEYIEETEDVEVEYPTHGGFMVVDHMSMKDGQMGGRKPCFHSLDDAVMWAEYNLDHNCYNVYNLHCVL